MFYINKFQTSGDVQTAVNKGTLLKPYVALITNTNVVDYDSIDVDYSKEPLTFEILSAGTITWMKQGSYSVDERTISYSTDSGSTWTNITSVQTGTSFNVNAGDIIQFKGDNSRYSREGNYVSYYSSFSGSTAVFNAYGNVMSLIDSTNYQNLSSVNSGAFVGIFESCTGLKNSTNLVLPATVMADSCYSNMFDGCTSLVTAPELPATTLGNYCYGNMFRGCTSLTTAPDLPTTTLATQCYQGMFYNCSSLNYIKCLATDISASNCTYYWVSSVPSTGTFVKAPSMNDWTTGIDGIPSGWTVEDAQ